MNTVKGIASNGFVRRCMFSVVGHAVAGPVGGAIVFGWQLNDAVRSEEGSKEK